MKINTPGQNAAIKKLMAARKRAWRAPALRDYPRFVPGETTTAHYIECYYSLLRRHQVPASAMYDIGTDAMNNPAPYYTGPEVTAMELEA